jgi:hypothetical protein
MDANAMYTIMNTIIKLHNRGERAHATNKFLSLDAHTSTDGVIRHPLEIFEENLNTTTTTDAQFLVAWLI